MFYIWIIVAFFVAHIWGILPSKSTKVTLFMNKSNKKERKFKLQEMLNNTPYVNRKQVRNDLVSLMEVSESTFDRILYAVQGEKQDISSTNLVRLACYFDVRPEELLQTTPDFTIGKLDLVK